MKKASLLIFSLLLGFGCIRKANISLPTPEQKLVVSCFISPADSLITATVRLSVPKFQTSFQYAGFRDDINNATVVISDGARSVNLAFDPDYYFYKARVKQFPVSAGKTYYLKVTTPDGKEVTASTTVPQNQLQIKTFDIIKSKDFPGELEYNVNVSADDIAGQTNYVAFGYRDPVLYKKSASYNFVDTTNTGGVSLSFFDDDERIQKQTFVNNFYYTSGSANDTIIYAAGHLAVLNCSKEFYLYNRSVTRGIDNNGNPFSDPVLIYSNITNGFGCFGAYIGTYAYKKIR